MVKVVIGILSIIVTGVLIPLIRKKTSAENIANTMALVEIAVKAAEQIYNQSGQGALKKKYVVNYLNEKGIKVSEADLNNMIEATVLELNKWKKELEARPIVNVINTEEIVKESGV